MLVNEKKKSYLLSSISPKARNPERCPSENHPLRSPQKLLVKRHSLTSNAWRESKTGKERILNDLEAEKHSYMWQSLLQNRRGRGFSTFNAPTSYNTNALKCPYKMKDMRYTLLLTTLLLKCEWQQQPKKKKKALQKPLVKKYGLVIFHSAVWPFAMAYSGSSHFTRSHPMYGMISG